MKIRNRTNSPVVANGNSWSSLIAERQTNLANHKDLDERFRLSYGLRHDGILSIDPKQISTVTTSNLNPSVFHESPIYQDLSLIDNARSGSR